MIGVVGLRRDEGKTGTGLASGVGTDDWVVRAREWWDCGDGSDASRLWGAGSAGVGTRSARVLGTTTDRLRGCRMGAQVRTVCEAEVTAPRLMAVDLALDGSWIGREW